MAKVPTSALAAGGLIGGYGVARWTKRRQLGAVPLATAGMLAARQWNRTAGRGTAVALSALYTAAFAGSHPLARRIGAWPAVFTAAGAVAAASWVAADRR